MNNISSNPKKSILFKKEKLIKLYLTGDNTHKGIVLLDTVSERYTGRIYI